MSAFSRSPTIALVAGMAVALVVALVASGGGLYGAGPLAVRFLHVAAAMVWGGFIVFVNLVQLAALAAASDGDRPVIVREIVPRTARVFAIAADATLATGLLMTWPLHASLASRPVLLAGIVGGIAMWAIVRFALKPNVARVTGRIAATDAEKAAARVAIALWARVNLTLLLPVTMAMLAAGHFGA
ncbi:MAG: hypothetical protein JNM89_14475 [Hyphomicrobiaceae bacterium]|nr:hypothetical protein [Hyphomicrobiaceae bacterium]